ncbi:hypothetical protein RUND412_008871 [Rhizina undulata]
MNFIVSLAHFCEFHGPTSILCTQVLPPACMTCYPSAAASASASATLPPTHPSAASVPTPPHSSHGYSHLASSGKNTLSPNAQPVPPRPSTAHSTPTTVIPSNTSTNVSSPIETPPPSPRSPVLTSSSLPSAGVGYLTGPAGTGMAALLPETCKNCTMSLPKSVNEKLPGNGGTSATGPPSQAMGSPSLAGKSGNPVLRTKEAVIACAPPPPTEGLEGVAEGEELQPRHHFQQQQRQQQALTPDQLSTSPASNAYYDPNSSAVSSDDETAQPRPPPSPNSNPPHIHYLTYLSTRAPTIPSRFSTLRQSCVRTLSCELIPAQTGPIMFGDPLAGYTIAYVFRLSDPKARGGRRSYALLCICPDQKVVVRSWKYVVATFESLVHRIKSLAAKKAVENAQASPQLSNSNSSIASRGPEGFLRRRAPGEGGFGGSQKGLAELVGREELFVEIHMCFVKLLGGLGRRFGYWSGGELGLSGTSGLISPVGGRSRAGSMCSTDERGVKSSVLQQTHPNIPEGDTLDSNTSGTATPNCPKSPTPITNSNTGLSVVENIPPKATPATATSTPNTSARGSAATAMAEQEKELGRNRPREVAVGY